MPRHKCVWQFPLTDQSEQTIEAPRGARFLTAKWCDGQMCLFALVDPGAQPEERAIAIIVTGLSFKDEDHVYIASVQMSANAIVLHVFEKRKSQEA